MSTAYPLTEEQQAILASGGPIRINAVAGSGKTSTLIEYARTRPAGARILYLAFNKAVRTEARQRFAAAGLPGVVVETAHSLAFRHVVPRNGYRVRAAAYRPGEIASLLGLSSGADRHGHYVLAHHIGRLVAFFCNSTAARVQDLDYPSTLGDKKVRTLVKASWPAILQGARQLLAGMDRGELEVTHDFYLKKFQLSHPVLPFDYVLFDEGQDASAAMLDVFLHQPSLRVIVGDTHQQIYSWRYAVNALQQVPFPEYSLTASFRFGPSIARLAEAVLSMKEEIGHPAAVHITGAGGEAGSGPSALIARTNLGLLMKAIEWISRHPSGGIYFEGNIHSYTYADEGASLYDVLNLHLQKFELIRDPLIASLSNLEELEEYVGQTEEVQLGMMVQLVREYGQRIPEILRTLKERHTGDEQRHTAERIFSTVHRCKGLEYAEVELAPDFITAARLRNALGEEEGRTPAELARLGEEINLLYVAVTRSRGRLRIPAALVPEGVPPLPGIEVLQLKSAERMHAPLPSVPVPPPRRLRRISGAEKEALLKKGPPAASGKGWTGEMDTLLGRLYGEGVLVREIARQLGRSEGAVMLRIRRLELDS